MCEREYGRWSDGRRVILTERKNEAAAAPREPVTAAPEGNHANLLQWGKIGNSVLRAVMP